MIVHRLAAAVAATAMLLVAAPASAQAPDTPQTIFVVDGASFVPDDVERRIDTRLRDHQRRTTNEVVLMTIPTIGGMPIESFAKQVFNTLGIGVKGKNNGVLIFVAAQDRKLRIQVGTGLERVVTDAEAKAIIDGRMVPALKANDPGRAMRAGVEGVLNELGDTAPIADDPPSRRPQDGDAGVGFEPGIGAGGLPAGPNFDPESLTKAADTFRSALPIFLVVGVIIAIAVVSRFVRGVGGVLSNVADLGSAAGYGRGVWFGGNKEQFAGYGDDGSSGLLGGSSFGSSSSSSSSVSTGGSSNSGTSGSSSSFGGGSTSGGGASGSW